MSLDTQETGAAAPQPETTTKPGQEIASFPMPEVMPASTRPATFNDHTEHVMAQLWATKDFRQFLDALTNKNAITGLYVGDRIFAAKRIKDLAQKLGLADVGSAKESRIMRAIEVILRRGGLGRNQRLKALAAPTAMPAE